jgi:hypothetical protein
MKRFIILIFVICFTLFRAPTAKGQNALITLQAGIGFSPGFNYFLIPPVPVTYDPGTYGHYPYYYSAAFTSITPLLNFVVDYRLNRKLSIGIATSYQSESVVKTWDNGSTYVGTDFISRLNIGSRLIYHLDSPNDNIDRYIGLRIGTSHWIDNYNGPPPPPYYSIIYKPFLVHTRYTVPSIQAFYGIGFCIKHVVGFHFEIGIGSSYLAEVGLNLKFGKASSLMDVP